MHDGRAFLLLVACATLFASDAPSRSELSAIDRSLPPCQDFYRYACGSWLATTPVPTGAERWMELNRMVQRGGDVLFEMVQEAARPDPARDPLTQKVGDYYAACMDTAAIEKRGSAPLQSELQRIRGVRSLSELMQETAHLAIVGKQPLFALSATRDEASGVLILQLAPPPRNRDEAYERARRTRRRQIDRAIEEYLATLFRLAGDSPAQAAAAQRLAMRAESALPGRGKRPPAGRRFTLTELDAWLPNLHFREQAGVYGALAAVAIQVEDLEYFRKLDRLLARKPLEHWRAFLVAAYLSDMGGQSPSVLPQAFSEAQGKLQQLLGDSTPGKPRDELCMTSLMQNLGEPLGKKYAERHLPPAHRRYVEAMVADMRAALRDAIESSTWMSRESKGHALVKLDTLEIGIGHNPRQRDYSALAIDRQDAFGNWTRIKRFEAARLMAWVGKPDYERRADWNGTTFTLWYEREFNSVQLPAIMLQPAEFNSAAHDAVNYAAVGAGITHELMHAFDNSGRLYDGQGNRRDWWTPEDARRYGERAQCFVAQYSVASLPGGLHVDGRRTLDENMSDSGGLPIAYAAFERAMARRGLRMDDPAAGEDGYTPAQLFFLSYAIHRCAQFGPDALKSLVAGDSHSPEILRVNLPVANCAAFQKAFGCKAGDALVPQPACTVW